MTNLYRASVSALYALGMAIHLPAFAHGDQHGAGVSRGPNLDFVEKPFGETGDPKKVTRTIRVVGTDAMRFSPARITIRRGETVRFVFKNGGKLNHESVLGTMADLKEHAELMKKFPGMEHDEPYMLHVAPGKTGEMIWRFTRPGEFYFGCLMPGHFEAGMVGSIVVGP